MIKRRRYNSIDPRKAAQVLKKTNGRCYYCGCALPEDTLYCDNGGKVYMQSRNWHVDHLVPYANGGTENIENLVPACKTCNLQKGTKSAEEFVAGRTA